METIKDIGKTDASTLANYVLKNYGAMSHLKLQKLLYYSQAYHLAYFNNPLFDDDFEAWMHGPVCRRVFRELRGASVLYSDVSFSTESKDPNPEIEAKLNTLQVQFVNEILTALSKWSGMELESATHGEMPWLNARSGYGPADPCTVIIKKEDMQSYYKKDLSSR